MRVSRMYMAIVDRKLDRILLTPFWEIFHRKFPPENEQ